MSLPLRHILAALFLVSALFYSMLPLQAQARSAPESFADLVEELMPTVVNISTSQTVDSGAGFGGGGAFPPGVFPPGHPFEEFNEFFDRFSQPGEGDGSGLQNQKLTSLGSGFLIDKEGFIATNYHVIENAEEIKVTITDDQQYDAKVIGFDSKTDLAVLKIEALGKKSEKFIPARFGDSDEARVGDWVIAIGNPFNLGGTVTAGIISARARDINAGPFDDFIQTDAAINRGNSGGPMFDVNGRVIGINTAIYSPSGGNVGIGFAVPSALAQPILEKLKRGEEIKRGWLGVKIQSVTEDIAESLGLKGTEGALVVEVLPDSPAAKAGVIQGDVIQEFDGKKVETMRKLPRIVAETEVGKRVQLTLWREGKSRTMDITLGELKEEEVASGEDTAPTPEEKKADEKAESLLGMSLLELTKKWRARYGIPDEVKGLLVVKVNTDSAAFDKGIRRGDVILEINQTAIKSVSEVEKQLAEAKKAGRKSLLLLVQREGEKLFIALPVGK